MAAFCCAVPIPVALTASLFYLCVCVCVCGVIRFYLSIGFGFTDFTCDRLYCALPFIGRLMLAAGDHGYSQNDRCTPSKDYIANTE